MYANAHKVQTNKFIFFEMGEKRTKVIRISDLLHEFLKIKSKELGVSVADCLTLIFINNHEQFKHFKNEREEN